MSTIIKVARNIGYLFAGRIAIKILSFLILLYVARYLGPDRFGYYSFAFAFVYFFAFITDMGMHNVLVREISKKPELSNYLIGNATILKIMLSILAFVLAIMTATLLNFSIVETKSLYIASMGLLVSSISAYGVIYETNMKNEYSIFFNSVSKLFLLLSVFVGIYLNQNLFFFIYVSVMSELIHNMLMYLFSKKYIKPIFHLNIELIKNILTSALPIAISSVFAMIYFRIDVVMLQLMTSNLEVGYYSAAYRLTEALIFIPSSFMTSIFPLMSRYFKSLPDYFIKAYERSFKYLFATGLFLAIIITSFSNRIIIFVYGDQYLYSASALQILIWPTFFMFINLLLSYTFISSNNQKYIAQISIFAAFINVLLNIVLIKLYGYNGAAVSTLITELIVMVIGINWVNNKMVTFSHLKILKCPVISASFVYIFIFIIKMSNIIILAPFSIIIYLAILYFTGWVDNYDKMIIKKIIGK